MGVTISYLSWMRFPSLLGPRVPDPALDQAAGGGRFGLDLFAYFLLQRPRTLRLLRTLWKFGAGEGLGRSRFGGERLGKARGDLLEGRHRLLFHRTQHHRIDQQEQQRNCNVAQRPHPGLDQDPPFVQIAGGGRRFYRGGLEGEVLHREQVAALIVDPDGGAGEFFDRLHFLRRALPPDAGRLAVFLFGVGRVVDQHGGGNAAHAPRGVQNMARIFADREGGAVGFRTLVVHGRKHARTNRSGGRDVAGGDGGTARNIARHARHARRIRPSREFFGMLLGKRSGRLRIVNFGGVFAAAQVIIHVHAGANVFGADHGVDGMHGGGGQFLIGIERRAARWTASREKRRCRVGVDHRNVLRPQAIDGARDQLRDGLLRFAGERAALRFYDHRGLRFALLLREQRLARQHQVDTHRLDFAQSLQRAFQFAFQGALVIHFFAEVRSRPVRRVEQFKPQAGVPRQALGGGFQARGVEFVGGNEDASAIRRN